MKPGEDVRIQEDAVSDAPAWEREHPDYLNRMVAEGVVTPALATKATVV